MFLHTHTLSHTEALTHRRFYTEAFTHRRLYTEAFTYRHFYTQTLLHTEAFTHRHFYTHTHFDTQRLLHTEAFTHRSFYRQKLSHTEAFTHKHFHTNRDRTHDIAILPQFLAIEPHFVRKGLPYALQIAILPQFLAIQPHFVRKGWDWTPEIAILPHGDRTSFRAKEAKLRWLHPAASASQPVASNFLRVGQGRLFVTQPGCHCRRWGLAAFGNVQGLHLRKRTFLPRQREGRIAEECWGEIAAWTLHKEIQTNDHTHLSI